MTRGIYCPACHSEHTWVHGARVLPDGGLAWDFRCLNCQTAFVWVYADSGCAVRCKRRTARRENITHGLVLRRVRA